MRTNSGPIDQRPLEQRADVLLYSSEPLAEPLEVTGPVTVMLHAATSARDTDFVAKLCDVARDGVSRDPGRGDPPGALPRGLHASRRERAGASL